VIQNVCVVGPEGLARNRESAAGRGLPRLAVARQKSLPLAVVGGGESAETCLDELKAWPGPIMAINGAYDWLQDMDRVPEYGCLIDPQPMVTEFLTRPARATRWLVASMCDPSVFNALTGYDVTVWEAAQHDADEGIPGGPTCMTRAPVVATWMGFRRVRLFGADSCYSSGRSHVYGGDLPSDLFPVRVGGREFVTSWGLLSQAEHLAALHSALVGQRIEIEFAGDHLAAALAEHGTWQLA
jgi:hypothetical protein